MKTSTAWFCIPSVTRRHSGSLIQLSVCHFFLAFWVYFFSGVWVLVRLPLPPTPVCTMHLADSSKLSKKKVLRNSMPAHPQTGLSIANGSMEGRCKQTHQWPAYDELMVSFMVAERKSMEGLLWVCRCLSPGQGHRVGSARDIQLFSQPVKWVWNRKCDKGAKNTTFKWLYASKLWLMQYGKRCTKYPHRSVCFGGGVPLLIPA